MKKFNAKKMDEVIQDAQKNGWFVDTEAFDKNGSDWIYLSDIKGKVISNAGVPRQIAYNTTNGWFFVYVPFSDKAVATHLSEELEGEKWYDSILELVYKPLAAV